MGRVPLVTLIGFGEVLLNVRAARRDRGRRVVEVGAKTRERKAPLVKVLNIVISLAKLIYGGKSFVRSSF